METFTLTCNAVTLKVALEIAIEQLEQAAYECSHKDSSESLKQAGIKLANQASECGRILEVVNEVIG